MNFVIIFRNVFNKQLNVRVCNNILKQRKNFFFAILDRAFCNEFSKYLFVLFEMSDKFNDY